MPEVSYSPPTQDYDPRPAYQRDADRPSRGYAVIMDPPCGNVPVKTRITRQIARIVILVGCAVIVYSIGTAVIEAPS